MINPKNKSIFKMLLEITKDLGILNRKKWLDIGCGNGDLTHFINSKNINCLGIDVEFKKGVYKDKLIKNNLIKLIESSFKDRKTILESNKRYFWPCETNSINFAFSSSVIEHIINLKEFASENARILDEGGYCAHYFPSRLALFEAHTGIPFGALFINKKYYQFATKLGFCKKKFNNWKDAIDYMRTSTNYMNHKQLIDIFKENNLKFIGSRNDLIIKYLGPKHLRFLANFKNFGFVFGIFRSKLYLFQKITSP